MKEVRLLEADIVIYQNELRTNIQQWQLKEYIEIGDEKLKDFFTNWEIKFAEFEEWSLTKMDGLKARTEEEMEALNMRLERAVEAVKIKPIAKLKELQCQEKLVALNERIEEAQNYWKELRDLEVTESIRVQMLREANAEKQRQELLRLFQKEM